MTNIFQLIAVEAAKDCFKEFKVNNQEILQWTVSELSFNPSQNFKCSFLCKMESLGVMEKNKLEKEKLREVMKKKPEVYEKCSKFTGDDCDVAFKTFSCLFETNVKSSG